MVARHELLATQWLLSNGVLFRNADSITCRMIKDELRKIHTVVPGLPENIRMEDGWDTMRSDGLGEKSIGGMGGSVSLQRQLADQLMELPADELVSCFQHNMAEYLFVGTISIGGNSVVLTSCSGSVSDEMNIGNATSIEHHWFSSTTNVEATQLDHFRKMIRLAMRYPDLQPEHLELLASRRLKQDDVKSLVRKMPQRLPGLFVGITGAYLAAEMADLHERIITTAEAIEKLAATISQELSKPRKVQVDIRTAEHIASLASTLGDEEPFTPASFLEVVRPMKLNGTQFVPGHRIDKSVLGCEKAEDLRSLHLPTTVELEYDNTVAVANLVLLHSTLVNCLHPQDSWVLFKRSWDVKGPRHSDAASDAGGQRDWASKTGEMSLSAVSPFKHGGLPPAGAKFVATWSLGYFLDHSSSI
mmetsp:Transcript_13511/g.32652  ORF Transcript_13511/g.32652 Transcript_13511/m.32652 type:complete len:417 (-) Transcript_13511:101-1351(-)